MRSGSVNFRLSPISPPILPPPIAIDPCQFGIEILSIRLSLVSALLEPCRIAMGVETQEPAGETNVGLQAVTRLPAVRPSQDARLIVVSNRLPLTLQKSEKGWTTTRSSGGLASAMNPMLQKGGGDWIGWPGNSGEQADPQRRAVLTEWAEKEHCFAVDLPEDVAAGFYEGYANQTLWPVFHNLPSHHTSKPTAFLETP